MTDFVDLYERLTSYEDVGRKDIESWLESVKQGESPNVSEKEKTEMRNIHEDVVARDIDRDEGVGQRFVSENLEHRSGGDVLTLTLDDGSTKEVPVSEVGRVEFQSGVPRVRNRRTGFFEEGTLEL